MSFDRAWVLLLAPMPFVWLALTWRRTERRWGLGLKAAALLAVILALAEPRLDTFETKVGAVVLVESHKKGVSHVGFLLSGGAGDALHKGQSLWCK